MISINNVLLRNFQESDITILLEIRNNIQIQEMLLSRPRPNDTTKLLNWIRNRIDSDTKEFFIIADMNTNIPVGFAQLNNIDFLSGHAEFGLCIHQNYHNKGFFKNAVSLLEKYAYDVLNIHKFIGFARAENHISLNTLMKLGYRNVGVFKEHFLYDGKRHDIMIIEKILI